MTEGIKSMPPPEARRQESLRSCRGLQGFVPAREGLDSSLRWNDGKGGWNDGKGGWNDGCFII